MNNLKRMIALLLALACMASFTACGADNIETEETAATVPQEQNTTATEQTEPAASENTDDTSPEADYLWKEIDGGVMVSGYVGTATELEIPAQLDGKTVLAIGEGAFSGGDIVRVTLPDTIVTIEKAAFLSCESLQEVVFGAGVKTIGSSAFIGCSSLEKAVLNEGLETIGSSAFSTCQALANVEIPSTVVTIDSYAFDYSGLTSITIPGSVEKIGEYAFFSCTALTEAVIEPGVKQIDSDAFSTCTFLAKVEIPDTVETFGEDIFNFSSRVVVHAPAGSAAETYAQENNIDFEAD